jgi:hypothetical protein
MEVYVGIEVLTMVVMNFGILLQFAERQPKVWKEHDTSMFRIK